jgi:hypothetical protein
MHGEAVDDAGGGRAFVGRERELGERHAGFADAVAGTGRLFMIVGEPGIGKTRLALEVAGDGVEPPVAEGQAECALKIARLVKFRSAVNCYSLMCFSSADVSLTNDSPKTAFLRFTDPIEVKDSQNLHSRGFYHAASRYSLKSFRPRIS